VIRLKPEQWHGILRDGLLTEPLPVQSFLESWFDDDSVRDGSRRRARINWGAVSGMALSFTISASFWVGLGMIIERIWK
jgi:hypothetical protein